MEAMRRRLRRPGSFWPPPPTVRCLLPLLLLLHHTVQGTHHMDHEFHRWTTTFQKVYASEREKAERYVHWKTQFDHVQRHKQAKAEATMDGRARSSIPYTLELNEFSDWSSDERRQRLLGSSSFIPKGWRKKIEDDLAVMTAHPHIFNGDKHQQPPAEVDWRDPAKNPKGKTRATIKM